MRVDGNNNLRLTTQGIFRLEYFALRPMPITPTYTCGNAFFIKLLRLDEILLNNRHQFDHASVAISDITNDPPRNAQARASRDEAQASCIEVKAGLFATRYSYASY